MATKATQTTAETVETTPIESPETRLIKEYKKSVEQKKEIYRQYMTEPKRKVYVSPMYKPYLGNVMPVVINGIAIYFPVDGSTHEVPETFANEIEARRLKIDEIINKQSNMANVGQNYETSPGELQLI